MTSGNLQLFIGRSGRASSLLHYGPKVSHFVESKLTFEADNGTDVYAPPDARAPDTFVFASENVTFTADNHVSKPFFKEFGAGHPESLLQQRASQHQVCAIEG